MKLLKHASITLLITFALVPSAIVQAQNDFTVRPASGGSTVVINGTAGDSVSIYQFDDAIQVGTADPEGVACSDALIRQGGTLLAIASAGTNATSTTSTTLAGTAPFSITLANPLLPATMLCIRHSSPGAVAFSNFITVTDINNPYPKVRTFYTAGAMVNNQAGANTSGSSSTGAEYVDIGMSFTGVQESNKYHLGISDSITGLFSSVSVAAPVTQPTQSSGSTSATNNGTLNILSSQESFRLLGNVAFPVKVGTNNPGYNFFGAPMVRVGVTTLLNPSATAATGSDGAITSTAATFAPVYWEGTAGLRIGYRKYPANKDAPTTRAQVDLMFGKFSNLQSFLCAAPASTDLTSTTKPTNTSCFTTVNTTAGTPPLTTTSYTLQSQLRSIQQRFDLSGYFLFPDTPFVLGFEANVPQSALAPKNLDILNKASGNITIYFGVSGNLSTLLKSLKLAGAPQ